MKILHLMITTGVIPFDEMVDSFEDISQMLYVEKRRKPRPLQLAVFV